MHLACGQDDGRVQGSHGGGVLQERTAGGAERQCEDKQEGEPTGRHPDLVSCFAISSHRIAGGRLLGGGGGGEGCVEDSNLQLLTVYFQSKCRPSVC